MVRRTSGEVDAMIADSPILGASAETTESANDDMLLDFEFAEAALTAVTTGNLTPLIKEELRFAIQTRRQASGLDDIEVNVKDEQEYRLTEEDLRRREERKVRNKTAAQKCRLKKKSHMDELSEQAQKLQMRRVDLKLDITKLTEERDRLMEMLHAHAPFCQKLSHLSG